MAKLKECIPFGLILAVPLIAYVTAENISVPVYGALGHSVYLHLNTTLNSSVHVEWKQGDNRIGVFKNNRPGFKDPYINRTEIFANGTLRLDRTQKNDSGDYSVDVFNTDGTNIFKGSMQVYIHEAVSQPVVHSTCLSQGEVLLVCTVYKGDNVSFNWSLDGVPLNPSLAYFSDEEYVVILKKHVSGNLVCIATNQVSTNQSDSVISNCSGRKNKHVICLALLYIELPCCFYIRHINNY
ncbi:T-cell surface antigen CD2-like [Huso huso]|uniref:T-cell surface antigen CD2-like n=1 Tax=Huso huso TaxID=61971 RepID=A0ABR0YQE7_HUSHU